MELTTHSLQVLRLRLVPTPRRGKLLIWDFAAGKVQAALDEGVMGFQAVTLSEDGATLVTGGIDRNVTLWAFDRLRKARAVK